MNYINCIVAWIKKKIDEAVDIVAINTIDRRTS